LSSIYGQDVVLAAYWQFLLYLVAESIAQERIDLCEEGFGNDAWQSRND